MSSEKRNITRMETKSVPDMLQDRLDALLPPGTGFGNINLYELPSVQVGIVESQRKQREYLSTTPAFQAFLQTFTIGEAISRHPHTTTYNLYQPGIDRPEHVLKVISWKNNRDTRAFNIEVKITKTAARFGDAPNVIRSSIIEDLGLIILEKIHPHPNQVKSPDDEKKIEAMQLRLESQKIELYDLNSPHIIRGIDNRWYITDCSDFLISTPTRIEMTRISLYRDIFKLSEL